MNSEDEILHLILCKECFPLRYCNHKEHVVLNRIISQSRNTLQYFIDKIPFASSLKHPYGIYTRHHLKIAYTAFHEDDYETTILHCLATTESNLNSHFIAEVFLCLAVTYFLNKNYIQASLYMEKYATNESFKGTSEQIDFFLLLCQYEILKSPLNTQDCLLVKIEKAMREKVNNK